MPRIVLRAAMSVVAVVVCLAASVAAAGTASAMEICRLNMVWAGSVGEVNASLAPNGYVQWGARSYVDDRGLWLAFVMVGRRQVDRKEQHYPPHGSVNPKDLRSGQVLRFLIYHVDTNGNKSVSRPDAACLLP
jgi:hypothetical protein